MHGQNITLQSAAAAVAVEKRRPTSFSLLAVAEEEEEEEVAAQCRGWGYTTMCFLSVCEPTHNKKGVEYNRPTDRMLLLLSNGV